MPQSSLDTRLLDHSSVVHATKHAWGNHVRGVASPEALQALCLQLGDTVGRGSYVFVLAHLFARKYAVLTPLVTRVMPSFNSVVLNRNCPKGSTVVINTNRTFLPSGVAGEPSRHERKVCVQVHDVWRPWEVPHHRKLMAAWWDPADMWVMQEYEIELDEDNEDSEEDLHDEDTPRTREQLRRSRVQRYRSDATDRLQHQNNRLQLIPVSGTGTFADIAYDYMRCLERGGGRERAYLHLMSLMAPIHMTGYGLATPEQRLAYCARLMNGKWW